MAERTHQGGGMSYTRLADGVGFYFGADIDAFDAACFAADLAAVERARPAELHVHLNSQGGDAVAAGAIYRSLIAFRQRTQASVVTRNCALVASAAVLPFLAGNDRVAVAGSFVAVHELTGAHSAQELARIRQDYVAIVSARTEQPAESVSAALRDTTLYSAAEAEAAGYVTRIAAGPTIAMAGRLNPSLARAAATRQDFGALLARSSAVDANERSGPGTLAETCYAAACAAGYSHSVAAMLAIQPRAATRAGFDALLAEARDISALVAHVHARYPSVFYGNANRLAEQYLFRRVSLPDVRATLMDELAAYDEQTCISSTRRMSRADLPQETMQQAAERNWQWRNRQGHQ